MMFKNSIRRGQGILNRGDRCMFRSMEARYLGSFKNEEDVHWNHMLLMQSVITGELVSIEEFIMCTTDTRQIVWLSIDMPPVEGQMKLC